MQIVTSLGGFFTMIELCCYLSIFHYISHHDNHVAVHIIKPAALQQRNRTNALTLTGQFIIWSMKFSFIVIVAVLSASTNVDFIRELTAYIKSVEFVLIPVVEVLTSTHILKHFLGAKSH